MKKLALGIIICFLSISLSAQTLKVSYKSHSSSLNTFDLKSKSFGLPGDLYLTKIKKIEEQTIETKPIQSLKTDAPLLKKIKTSTTTEKKALKKQQKKAKKNEKRKVKEQQKKANKTKSASQSSLVHQSTSTNNTFQLLLLSLIIIVIIVAILPTTKK